MTTDQTPKQITGALTLNGRAAARGPGTCPITGRRPSRARTAVTNRPFVSRSVRKRRVTSDKSRSAERHSLPGNVTSRRDRTSDRVSSLLFRTLSRTPAAGLGHFYPIGCDVCVPPPPHQPAPRYARARGAVCCRILFNYARNKFLIYLRHLRLPISLVRTIRT